MSATEKKPYLCCNQRFFGNNKMGQLYENIQGFKCSQLPPNYSPLPLHRNGEGTELSMKNWLKQITNFLPLIAIALLAYSLPKFTNQTRDRTLINVPQNRELPASEVWQVSKVSDGDTITVTRGIEKQKVRFACIDAPEKAQPLGSESKANLQRLIDAAGGQVLLQIVDTDRYGRKVAEVFTSNNGRETFLQEEQLKAGLAYVYEQYIDNCLNAEPLRNAQSIAKSNRAGVWAGNNVLPWDYRKAK